MDRDWERFAISLNLKKQKKSNTQRKKERMKRDFFFFFLFLSLSRSFFLVSLRCNYKENEGRQDRQTGRQGRSLRGHLPVLASRRSPSSSWIRRARSPKRCVHG
uniref:Uncharacterized protein n=2 Tax=Rhizophora mucronata TaxID=61149 RepID=A0A2P2JV09_RHIMU